MALRHTGSTSLRHLYSWLRWVPKPAYAITLAALTTFTIISLWQPSEFIYYQF